MNNVAKHEHDFRGTFIVEMTKIKRNTLVFNNN